MLHPPGGTRFLDLRGRDSVKSGKKSRLAIKLQILKESTIKVQVSAAKELASTHDEINCNPFVEFYWLSSSDGSSNSGTSWDLIWVTAPKGSTGNPSWDAEDGAIVFLPPVWTSDHVLLFSSATTDGIRRVESGCWVPRNYDEKLFSSARLKAVLALIAAYQASDEETPQVDGVVEELLKQFRNYAMLAENERRKMWEEEEAMRALSFKNFCEDNKTVTAEQRIFLKEFSSLQSEVQHTSNLMARLRFILAESLDSGSALYYCCDPATGQNLRLYAIPIGINEDEMEFRRKFDKMIFDRPSNVVKVLEFSVHSIRAFACNGISTRAARVGLAVTEHTGGNLEGFIREKGATMSSEELRSLLRSVAVGLKHLHSLGILHGNIHMGSFAIVPGQSQMACFLDDLWIFHSPRQMVWGCPLTRPPEANIGIVHEKSDVFAFGASVYFIATSSRHSTRISPLNHSLPEVLRTVPCRWSDWIHPLLKMCLEPNLDSRGTADDICNFLGPP